MKEKVSADTNTTFQKKMVKKTEQKLKNKKDQAQQTSDISGIIMYAFVPNQLS